MRDHGQGDLTRIAHRVGGAEDAAVGIQEDIGRLLIGRPPDHHAVHPRCQMFLGLGQRGDAAVDRQVKVGPLGLHPVDQRVVERRNIAVFLGAQTLQPRLSGVDREPAHTGVRDAVEEIGQHRFRVLIVHADPAFHRDLDRACRADHRRRAARDEVRVFHQHRAEGARLNPVRRAADIQVHLVIPAIHRHAGRLGQFLRVRATQLQRDGMLRGVEIQQMRGPAPHQRGRRHHLGIK